jgi:hypothetical protein
VVADTLRDEAAAWAARAAASAERGRSEEASRLFRRAAEASDDPAERTLHLSNAATAAAAAGATAEALSLLEAASKAAELPGVDDGTAAFVLANLAQWRNGEGRWEAAETLGLRAAERARAAEDGETEARAWRIVADARRLQGAGEEARRALDLAERAGPTPRESREIRFVRSLIALDAGDTEGALTELRGVADESREAKERASELRARLAQVEAATTAGFSAEATRAAARARELASGPREHADVEQRAASVALSAGNPLAATERIGRCLEYASAWIEEAADGHERTARLRAARGWVETALGIWFPAGEEIPSAATAGRALSWIRRVHGQTAGAALPREGDDLSVVWFWGATRVVGLLEWEEAGEVRHRVFDAGSPDELREWILLFRGLLASLDRAAERDDVGALLASRLLPDPATRPRGRLLAEPDGPLAALPLSVLPTPDGPLGVARPIVDACAFLAVRESEFAPSPETRVLADPVLIPSERALGSLPGAREEAAAIGRANRSARIFVGADADEAKAREMPPPSILHIATHTDPDPERPALLLAPDEEFDGRLEPEEIRALQGAPRIVILSGCETALADIPGRTAVGEISAAFLEAGAVSVIGALWKVEDRALGKFMAALHERLAAGDRPSEALRRARGAMLLSPRSDLTDPFLWGAFVVRGRDEPAPLPPARTRSDPTRLPNAALGIAAAAGLLAMLLGTMRAGRRRT